MRLFPLFSLLLAREVPRHALPGPPHVVRQNHLSILGSWWGEILPHLSVPPSSRGTLRFPKRIRPQCELARRLSGLGRGYPHWPVGLVALSPHAQCHQNPRLMKRLSLPRCSTNRPHNLECPLLHVLRQSRRRLHSSRKGLNQGCVSSLPLDSRLTRRL